MMTVASRLGTLADIAIDLTNVARVMVLGAGKATARMALAAENLLAERIADGIISVKYGHTESLDKIRLMEAGHGFGHVAEILAQGRGDMDGAVKVLELAAEMHPDDVATHLMRSQVYIFHGDKEGAIASAAITEHHHSWIDDRPCPVVIINGSEED